MTTIMVNWGGQVQCFTLIEFMLVLDIELEKISASVYKADKLY